MNNGFLSPRSKRLLASFLAGTMVLPAGSAFATSANYTGFVLQLPGVYSLPPDVNVMFTLDDSGSMLSDAIPDIPSANVPTGMPTDSYSNALGQDNATFPGMWMRTWDCVDWRQDRRGRWFCNAEGWIYSQYLTAELYSASNKAARYLRSSAGNPLYYDPKVTYLPWPKATDDKTLNSAANPGAVNLHASDPFNTGYQINLKTQYTDANGSKFWPATYFVYKGATPLQPGNPNDANNIQSNFIKWEIRSDIAAYPRDANRTDCTGAVGATGCTYAQELQNFANWLQYYRSRFLMAKGGVSAAFAKQGTNLRVGFATINTSGAVKRGVASFSGTRRTDFYTTMYGVGNNGGTPLRKAMDNVGKYFQRSDVGNPWAEDPTSNSVGTEYACRRSFHILSTDGFWNGDDASSPANNDNDSFSGNTPAKPDGTKYAYSNSATSSTDPLVGRFTIFPFAFKNSSTLADVAAYYWKTDLRSDLANTVAPSSRDPAFWQHLTTFTIGLGINGTGKVKRTSDGSTTVPMADPVFGTDFGGKGWVSDTKLRDLLVSKKVELTWTSPSGDSQETGDDLIHSAMNGRGRYFSATNPTDLANGLASALAEVADQPLDLASLAADASQLRANGKLYQATFNPNKWYGRLYAFKQNAATGQVNNKPSTSDTVNPDQVWEASNKMPTPSNRNIFTSQGNTSTGTSFLWASLTSGQKASLNNDSTVLDYLRGDGSREVANGGAFRDRSRYTVSGITGGVLGDVVNGSPVKGPDAGGGYDRLPTTDPARAAYSSYRTSSNVKLANLRNTIFLGANDGMAHAFNVDTGVERFAYVPNAVYSVPRSTAAGAGENKLLLLSDPSYTHRFTVDGPPNVSDAYIDDGWKSFLVGSTGAGARSIYVMDVSDTEVKVGGFGNGSVMWEFSEANSNDMGFVLSYPHVVRMRNGSWAVVFGNGYDSVNGKAKLFILDLKTRAVLGEFTLGDDINNGLGQPNIVLNSNREATTIYAGDLKGNLWKIDVSDPTPSKWAVAFSGKPLFSTSAIGAGVQPITVMPEVVAHPNGGAMLLFGTGKLFEANDVVSDTSKNINLANKQSLYGIWDKPGETSGISGAKGTVLRKQDLATTPSGGFATTTNNVPDWTSQRGWYLDLDGEGERSNISPQIINNVLLMVANKPQSDPCSNGGTARIFGLDAVTGASPSFSVFTTGNVRVENGVVTQPLIQYFASAGGSNDVTLSMPFNDRGQLNGARSGGVELNRKGDAPCTELLSYARTDTSIEQQTIRTCNKKPRISWRQLK